MTYIKRLFFFFLVLTSRVTHFVYGIKRNYFRRNNVIIKTIPNRDGSRGSFTLSANRAGYWFYGDVWRILTIYVCTASIGPNSAKRRPCFRLRTALSVHHLRANENHIGNTLRRVVLYRFFYFYFVKRRLSLLSRRTISSISIRRHLLVV